MKDFLADVWSFPPFRWMMLALVLLFLLICNEESRRKDFYKEKGVIITDQASKRDPLYWGKDKNGKFILFRDREIIFQEK